MTVWRATAHAKDRMRKRNIEWAEVYHVVTRPNIVRPIQPGQQRAQLIDNPDECRVLHGDRVTVIANVQRGLVFTAYPSDGSPHLPYDRPKVQERAIDEAKLAEVVDRMRAAERRREEAAEARSEMSLATPEAELLNGHDALLDRIHPALRKEVLKQCGGDLSRVTILSPTRIEIS